MQEFAVPPLQGMMQIMLWKGLLNRTSFFSNHIFELYYENCSDFILVSGFVCVGVLQPSQPIGVMSSAVSFPNHTLLGRRSPLSG